jgi:hypothetical protein
MILKAERRTEAAYAVADNSDAHLPLGYGRPFLLFLPILCAGRANAEAARCGRSKRKLAQTFKEITPQHGIRINI